MRQYWKSLFIVITCVLIALGLYFHQGQLAAAAIVAFLGLLALIMDLVGVSLGDLFRREARPSKVPEIVLKREYRSGPIDKEEILFRGKEATDRYVNGMSKLLVDRALPEIQEIATAKKHVQSDRYSEADTDAAQAIRHLEGSALTAKDSAVLLSQAYLIRGDAAFNSKLFAEAENYYTHSRTLANLSHNEFLMIASSIGVAIAKGSQGKNTEALDILGQILRSHSDCAEAWYNKGVALDMLGRPDEALVAFDGTTKLRPTWGQAWSNKGAMLGRLGRYEEAFSALNKAVELVPKYAVAWNNIGTALAELGRHEQALAAFDQATSLNPRYAIAWASKGYVLDELGKHMDAVSAYDEALRLDPERASVWNNKGVALSKLGRPDQALAAYEEAIRRRPEYDLAWVNKGLIFGFQGKHEQALAAYDEAIKINSKSVEAWVHRGTILVMLRREQEASSSLRQAVRLNPNFAMAWYNRAAVLLKLGRYDEADEAISRALRIDPNDEDAKRLKQLIEKKARIRALRLPKIM